MAPAFLAVLVAPVWAQENTDSPKGWLRILPVGDAPPFLQEVREDVRQELPTPEGAIPPRELVVPVRKGQKDGEGKIRLRLGRVSQAFPVSPGPLVLSADQNADDPEGWTKITMPQQSAALAIMFRDPRGKTWDSVRSIVLPDDATSFPAGRVRFVNASPLLVNVSFQGKNIAMKPGQVIFRQSAEGGAITDEPLQVAVRDAKGRTKRIFDSAISQSRGERTNVIIHWADGENPRRPARVLLQRERPVKPRSDRNSGSHNAVGASDEALLASHHQPAGRSVPPRENRPCRIGGEAPHASRETIFPS